MWPLKIPDARRAKQIAVPPTIDLLWLIIQNLPRTIASRPCHMFMLHLLITLCAIIAALFVLTNYTCIYHPSLSLSHTLCMPCLPFCTYVLYPRTRPPPFDFDCLQIEVMID